MMFYVFESTSGLVNPSCTGLIGSGVVIHLPSFFQELDALQDKGKNHASSTACALNTLSKGLDCSGRLFVSDRAHLVFDFHQIVDGLKEVELGGSRYVFHSLIPRASDRGVWQYWNN